MRTWIIALIALCAVTLILSVAPLFVPSRHYEKFVITQLSKKIPYNIQVASVKFRLLPHPTFMLNSVVLKDVELFSGREFVTVEKLRGDVSLLSLLVGDFDLDLKITKAKINILCNDTMCNIDSLLSDSEKPKKEQKNIPAPPSDIPVIPMSKSYLKDVFISNAHAISRDFFIKRMIISESEVHYFHNGVERLAILNINSRVDPFDTGYKFAMQAGSHENPVLMISGVVGLDKWRGVLRASSLDGYLMNVPIKVGFEYCSDCNPRLQKWSLNAPNITPKQINTLIGQFDLELPPAIEWGGRFGLVVNRQPSEDLNLDVDLTQTMIVWQNIFNKQPDLSQKITLNWKDGELKGDIVFLNKIINLTGAIKNYDVSFKGSSSDFDLMVLKTYLPILKDLESVVEPRIEFQTTGKTYNFPEYWSFNGSIFAKNLITSNGSIDDAAITINTEDGLKISKIEGTVFDGHLIGQGEMMTGMSEYLKLNIQVEKAEINRLPVVKNLVMGLVDINFILERDSFNESIKGELLSQGNLSFIEFENLFKNIDSSWSKLGGAGKISETVGNKISDFKCVFRKISKDEYLFDEIQANIGSSVLKLYGSSEVLNNETYLKGNLSIPSANVIAGKNTPLLSAGVMDIPIIISGDNNGIGIDIDADEFALLKDRMKIIAEKAKEEQELLKIKEKEKIAEVNKAKKLEVAKTAPEIKKPVVQEKPKPIARPKEVAKEPTPQIQKIGQDDFFKIVIGG